jgi:fatty acid desaturase
MTIQSALKARSQWDDLRRDVRREHWRRSFFASLSIWFGAAVVVVSVALAMHAW